MCNLKRDVDKTCKNFKCVIIYVIKICIYIRTRIFTLECIKLKILKTL